MFKRFLALLGLLFLSGIIGVSNGWAGTYYMRADGTAANKAAATSSSSATTSMSVATHNAETFSPGDIIYLSDKGGTYVPSGPQNHVLVPPSDGASGNPIIYAKVPGETPTINMLWDFSDGGGGWDYVRSGVYISHGFVIGRMVWEDGVALKMATSAANVGSGGDGSWYYSSSRLTWAPSNGNPNGHTLKSIFYDEQMPSVAAIDLRERSFIDLSGIVVNYGVIRIGQQLLASSSTVLEGIKVHDCTINYSPWAIVGFVRHNNCIFLNGEFYNNTINYSNSGISLWTNSYVSHTSRPEGMKIYNNTINHHFSIDSVNHWQYANYLQNPYDHEGISIMDSNNCVITYNTISCDPHLTSEYTIRAIFNYLCTGNAGSRNNIIAYNRITGPFDRAINFSTDVGVTFEAEGNIIACNTVIIPNNPYPRESYSIYIDVINSASGMNYVCNNSIFNTNEIYGRGIYVAKNGKWTVANNIVFAQKGNCLADLTNPSTDYTFKNNNYTFGGFYIGATLKSWNEWKANGWDNDGNSYHGTHPMMRPTDLALTTRSPAWCINGGTPIEGITVISGVGQLGIDGQAFHPTTPSMGAYAQPIVGPSSYPMWPR